MVDEILKSQRPPMLGNQGIERKNWPDQDGQFNGLARQLDHCEFIHRKKYPVCQGCPVRDLCIGFIDALSERQSQNQNITAIDMTLYYKILDLFSTLATRGNGHSG